MEIFEWIILLLLAAAAFAELARRIGVPYPTLLAVGGVCLAFLPAGPRWTLDPQLALALFVAPVLLDAAYDTSLRDLRANWRPVTSLVIAAVGTTVIGVAIVCRWLVPDMPWAVAVALGAIVAPPDAAAATAVMRQVGLPHRVLSILEGESLLNDASALFVYRLALMTMIVGPLGFNDYLPVFLLTVFGSIAAGIGLAFVLKPVMSAPKHVPTSLILQFSCTFGVWILAEKVGLSGILTMVAFAMTMARGGGPSIPARMRVPIFAVWETVVFVLNALAFVLIGMQLRPIWERLSDGAARVDAVFVATVVLGVVIATRFLWVMGYSALVMYQGRKLEHSQRPKRSLGGGLVVSWAGMRGIVTLAAAFAVPETLPNGSPFPYRDLILLCAFAVVFGTLVLQGLTMKPLIRLLKLKDDEDPVSAEIRSGRTVIYQALLESIKDDDSLHALLLKKEYQAAVELNGDDSVPLGEVPGGPLRRHAIAAARRKAIELLNQEIIGDQAFRTLVQELDLAELSAGGSGPV
ncbi:sodium/proton antiporter, CPA1 family [Variovorax sp. YR266]|uniref:cation:proton antiporter n=1 Tax=Variovorax sp. YR266 TaxID=1884386 RepID=UPI0008951A37|nr:cation:proton antiporter [Variovorax sp. YR266]SDZ70776.1 sodium/proton antiporter, CPA1 family [Variovorax sp. YR266]